MKCCVNFELIKYWDEYSAIYRYYWISKDGIISSPKFDSEQEANEHMKQTISFFERYKEFKQK